MNPKRLKEIYSKQETCFYCGVRFSSLNPPTRDHSWPKSRKGLNDTFNIVLSCSPCNTKKGDNLPSVEQTKEILSRTEEKIETLNTHHNAKIARLQEFTTMLKEHIHRATRKTAMSWNDDIEK